MKAHFCYLSPLKNKNKNAGGTNHQISSILLYVYYTCIRLNIALGLIKKTSFEAIFWNNKSNQFRGRKLINNRLKYLMNN